VAFAGIPADGFAFLRELANEQNKPWFEANRQRYEAGLKQPCADLVVALSEACARRDLPLRGDPKRSTFRLHRDVRFSKDKSPYKTHVGIVLMRPGAAKVPNGVLYVHVQPRDSFAGAAFYAPEPPVLNALRAAIRSRAAAWQALERDLSAQGLAFEDGDPLSRMPRGYEDAADLPIAAALRRRTHMIRCKLTQRELGQPEVVDRIAGFAAASLPFLRFGWDAMEEAPATPASRLDRFLPKRGA